MRKMQVRVTYFCLDSAIHSKVHQYTMIQHPTTYSKNYGCNDTTSLRSVYIMIFCLRSDPYHDTDLYKFQNKCQVLLFTAENSNSKFATLLHFSCLKISTSHELWVFSHIFFVACSQDDKFQGNSALKSRIGSKSLS